MNTDEKFNHYVERIRQKHGEPTARMLERVMSQMLELGCTPAKVWAYAEREINSE